MILPYIEYFQYKDIKIDFTGFDKEIGKSQFSQSAMDLGTNRKTQKKD
ncbi:MAG: hypothetical protein GY817_07900 [bacterium]|nr:hypothetical protein [bacterium]